MRHGYSTEGVAYVLQILLIELSARAREVASCLPFVAEAGNDARHVWMGQNIVQRDGREIFGRCAEPLLELLEFRFQLRDGFGAERLLVLAMITRLELRRLGGIVLVKQSRLRQRA